MRPKMDEIRRKDREYTWLGLIALGITVNEIAAAYQVSVPTVYAVTREGRKDILAPDKDISPSLVRSLGKDLDALPIETREQLINPNNTPRFKCATAYLHKLTNDAKYAHKPERTKDLFEIDPSRPFKDKLRVKADIVPAEIFRCYNPQEA